MPAAVPGPAIPAVAPRRWCRRPGGSGYGRRRSAWRAAAPPARPPSRRRVARPRPAHRRAARRAAGRAHPPAARPWPGWGGRRGVGSGVIRVCARAPRLPADAGDPASRSRVRLSILCPSLRWPAHGSARDLAVDRGQGDGQAGDVREDGVGAGPEEVGEVVAGLAVHRDAEHLEPARRASRIAMRVSSMA